MLEKNELLDRDIKELNKKLALQHKELTVLKNKSQLNDEHYVYGEPKIDFIVRRAVKEKIRLKEKSFLAMPACMRYRRDEDVKRDKRDRAVSLYDEDDCECVYTVFATATEESQSVLVSKKDYERLIAIDSGAQIHITKNR